MAKGFFTGGAGLKWVLSLSKIGRWVVVLFGFNLIVRLLLINWNTAEYTDSILYMTCPILRIKCPPLYAAFLQLLNFIFNDLQFSGKLISVLAGSLSVFPLYLIGKQVYNQKSGLYAVLLYSVSPVTLRWSIRVMNNPIFGLFFLLSVWFAIRFWRSQQRRDLIWCTFMAGLSVLTRVNGILFLPLLVLLYVVYLRKNSLKQLALSLVWVGTIPWWLLIAWLLQNTRNFFRYLSEFRGYEKGLSLAFILRQCIFNVEALLWAVSVPIFALACFGVYQSLHRSENNSDIRNFWLGLCSYLFVAWFAVVSTWYWMQTRHFYGIIPLIFLLSGHGIYSIGYHARRQWLFLSSLAGCILFSSVFSVATIYYQRDSFGDIKRAAVYARNELQGETIFSDEMLKTSFWAHRPLRYYRGKEGVQAGQYIILHSFYTNIDRALSYLASSFETEIIYETTSRIKPLLADILSNRPRDTNTPKWLLQRFETQRFRTIVIKLAAK